MFIRCVGGANSHLQHGNEKYQYPTHTVVGRGKHTVWAERWHAEASEDHVKDSIPCTRVATIFNYKFATHLVSTEHRIHTNELSPVRLPLALVASLIKLLFAVCSP